MALTDFGKQLASWLRQAMRTGTEAEVTQVSLSRDSGVGRPTIGKILDGAGESVTQETLNSLAKALEVQAPVIERKLVYHDASGQQSALALCLEVKFVADRLVEAMLRESASGAELKQDESEDLAALTEAAKKAHRQPRSSPRGAASPDAARSKKRA